MADDVLGHALVARQRPRHHRMDDQTDTDEEEDDDRDDLDHGQHRLDEAVASRGQQVNAADDNDDGQSDSPLRNAREPPDEKGGRASDFQARHHDEHDPVQPADRKACPSTDTGLSVGGEGTSRRQ